eukprot:6859665-Pyramimonas_sp.AAC.1
MIGLSGCPLSWHPQRSWPPRGLPVRWPGPSAVTTSCPLRGLSPGARPWAPCLSPVPVWVRGLSAGGVRG